MKRKKVSCPKEPLEVEEQAAFVHYLRLKNYKFSMIPNDTYTKSWSQKRRNKMLGLNGGLPDLLVIVKNKLVFIEMKRRTSGRVSKNQKEWLSALNKCLNVSAYVAKGADEAIKIIKNEHNSGTTAKMAERKIS